LTYCYENAGKIIEIQSAKKKGQTILTDRKFGVVFISWQPYCSRSDHIAEELGGKSFKIYFGFLGSHYLTISFKYLLQFFSTILILMKERPTITFVMSPPVFAAIPVYLYCLLTGKRFIIDAHTGAFDDPLWKPVMFLQKYFIRKALSTIVTNQELRNVVSSYKGAPLIIPDVPIIHKDALMKCSTKKKKVTMINTFSKDEPLENFLKACQCFNDIQFFVTGRICHNHTAHLDYGDDKIKFTDFLKDEDFYGLIRASDLIVVLTTRDRTMQRGAYEAIYNGKPIVTSKWKVLEENFPIGSVFVDNSVEGIREGIKRALDNLETLSEEVEILKGRKILAWKNNRDCLLSKIEEK